MKKTDIKETLSSKYAHSILTELLDGIYDSEIYKSIYDELVEFAGAVEHHLSTEYPAGVGIAKLVENQQDMPPEFIKAINDNFDKLL